MAMLLRSACERVSVGQSRMCESASRSEGRASATHGPCRRGPEPVSPSYAGKRDEGLPG